MYLFRRNNTDDPEGRKLTAARDALASDPVNRGDGTDTNRP
ncbi:hypothetical protein ACH4FX_12230 [Streptomyces sp. NPDC018019]